MPVCAQARVAITVSRRGVGRLGGGAAARLLTSPPLPGLRAVIAPPPALCLTVPLTHGDLPCPTSCRGTGWGGQSLGDPQTEKLGADGNARGLPAAM